MEKLTQAVTELRRRLGDSQQAFATRLGLSIRAIGNYEKDRNPTGRALAQLERAATDAGHSDLAARFRDALADELGTLVRPMRCPGRDYQGEGGSVRDPRRDPQPGDVLIDSAGQIIIVRHLGPGESRDLKIWRKAMRGAIVIPRPVDD